MATRPNQRLVLEGAGAIGSALLLAGRADDLGRDVAVVCTGDKVDIAKLLETAARHPDV